MESIREVNVKIAYVLYAVFGPDSQIKSKPILQIYHQSQPDISQTIFRTILNDLKPILRFILIQDS